MTNSQIKGIQKNPLYRLMVNCLIINFFWGVFFLPQRRQQQKFLNIFWFCFSNSKRGNCQKRGYFLRTASGIFLIFVFAGLAFT